MASYHDFVSDMHAVPPEPDDPLGRYRPPDKLTPETLRKHAYEVADGDWVGYSTSQLLLDHADAWAADRRCIEAQRIHASNQFCNCGGDTVPQRSLHTYSCKYAVYLRAVEAALAGDAAQEDSSDD